MIDHPPDKTLEDITLEAATEVIVDEGNTLTTEVNQDHHLKSEL